MNSRKRLPAIAVQLTAACAAPAQPASRPNVVLIIADDLAWDDVAANGNQRVRTPPYGQETRTSGNCASLRQLELEMSRYLG